MTRSTLATDRGEAVAAVPAIDVDGVGRIAFPILPVQAERLSAIAEAAPFGRGEETVIEVACTAPLEFRLPVAVRQSLTCSMMSDGRLPILRMIVFARAIVLPNRDDFNRH